jgi:hypothetical protein
MTGLLGELKEASEALTEGKKRGGHFGSGGAAAPGDSHLFGKPDPDEFPPIKGMEGPFRYKSGRVLYYDPKEGKYYDRKKDMYLDKGEVVEARRPEFVQYTVYAASAEEARRQFEKSRPGVKVHSIERERPSYETLNDKILEFTVNVEKSAHTEETGSAGVGAGLPKPMAKPVDGPDDGTDDEEEAPVEEAANKAIAAMRGLEQIAESTTNPSIKAKIAGLADKVSRAAGFAADTARRK